jgi:hypothetical protein
VNIASPKHPHCDLVACVWGGGIFAPIKAFAADGRKRVSYIRMNRRSTRRARYRLLPELHTVIASTPRASVGCAGVSVNYEHPI